MKKITKIFALALACMMIFALQTPTHAAEKASVQGVNQPQVTVQAEKFTHGVTGLYYDSSSKKATVYIQTTSSSYYRYQVQLLNYTKKKVLATEYGSYISFNLKKNQLYYYRVRATSYDYSTGQYVPVSNWSYGYGINTGICSIKLSGKKVKIKTPKIKGIKKLTLYMSTNKQKGYKKVKTVKAGSTVTLTKFNKKAFKKYKDYYYYVVSTKKQYKFGHSFYIRTVFR